MIAQYCASPPKKFLKINNVLDFIFAIIVASLVYLSIILILIMFLCVFQTGSGKSYRLESYYLVFPAGERDLDCASLNSPSKSLDTKFHITISNIEKCTASP